MFPLYSYFERNILRTRKAKILSKPTKKIRTMANTEAQMGPIRYPSTCRVCKVKLKKIS